MFSEEERKTLEGLKGVGGHVWVHDARVRDEGTYNAILKSCDVLYAAYEEFPHSSNTLTKAAIFKKPVIVSDGFLMAARVSKFQTGVVLPKGWGDEDLAEAVAKVLEEDAGRDFLGFCEVHSMERLEEKLGKFFEA